MSNNARFAALDGLRGIAALTVVIFHAVGGVLPGDHLIHAPLAVDLFFVLSGFVIGYAYDDKLRDGRLSFWGFVRVRMIRLYPLILLGALLAGGVLLSRVGLHSAHALLGAAVAILGSLAVAPLPLGAFTPAGYDTAVFLNSPEWSLFFEIAINLGYAAIAPRLKSRHLVVLTILGAVGLIALYATGYTGATEWIVFLSGFPRVLFSFSAGLLLYRHRSSVTFGKGAPWLVPLSLGLLAVLLAPRLWPKDDIAFTLVALPAFVLIGAHLEVGRRAAAIAEWGGRVSYPLYMIHFPILRLLNHVTRDRLSESGRLWALAVEIPVIVGLSWLALVFFDEPVRAALSRWRPRRQTEQLAATASAGDQSARLDEELGVR